MGGEQHLYERAHAREQALIGLYIHASAFLVVNIALFAINALVGGAWWFYWPLMGWGIGLEVGALSGRVRLRRGRTLGPSLGGTQDARDDGQ